MSTSSFPHAAMAGVEPLQASADDTTPSGSDDGFQVCSPSPISTNTVTITAQGGVPPYTYSWVQIGGAADGGPFGISNANSNVVSWNDVRCDNHVNNSEQWRCTVTDDEGRDVTVTITATLIWANLS